MNMNIFYEYIWKPVYCLAEVETVCDLTFLSVAETKRYANRYSERLNRDTPSELWSLVKLN